jgi:hypothetical protein
MNAVRTNSNATVLDSEDNLDQHRLIGKVLPFAITGLVSVVALGGTYFFGTVWDITTRLDRECPIVHRDIATLQNDVGELRQSLAAYPREYELRSAIDKASNAAEYRGADQVAMEELKRQIIELKADFRERFPYRTTQ